MRNVLLIEPNYKNKYPPLGLMKLASYHRKLGDNVTFFKGNLKDFVLDHTVKQCVEKLSQIDGSINWPDKYQDIKQYIKTNKRIYLEQLSVQNSKYISLILHCIDDSKNNFKHKNYEKTPYWDRICIATLFTFHWKITFETINFAKTLVKDKKEIWVGGVLATLLPEEVFNATEIYPWIGLLDKPGILDNNDIIIDDEPLDYSILDEIEYKYSTVSAYYGYMTRGCIRKCDFCAVPILEPKYNNYISLENKIDITNKKFGEQRHLVLLDNNVLASKNFPQIIEEIQRIGFTKDAKFIEPNYLKIYIKNLLAGYNEPVFKKKILLLITQLLHRLTDVKQQELYNLLDKYKLLKLETATKENILAIYPLISETYEKYRNKTPKKRYVDFNQGIDARLINEQNIQLLSKIPLNPLRIAFDSTLYAETYEKAIRLAAKHNINRLSNYLLYNETDKPVDLYDRIRLNIELSAELHIDIYSFPMKYHPIADKNFYFNRDYLGKFWNRKFIRAIQSILNATKGKIGKSESFFYKAFGATHEEYEKLLYMPEALIIYRFHFENDGTTDLWWHDFNNLNKQEKKQAKKIIENNDFKNISLLTDNTRILKVLKYYTIKGCA